MSDVVTEVAEVPDQPLRDRLEVRRTIWIVITGILIILMITAPIRIQYWVIRELRPDQYFWVEDRRWEPIRHIWSHPFQTVPDFGSPVLVDILFAASSLIVFAGVLYGLWLILVQAPETDA